MPLEAVQDIGEGPVLNVIRNGKSAVLHPRLGLRDKQWVEVLDTDVRPGEEVILEGGYNLPSGTAVVVDRRTKEESRTAEKPAVGDGP